VVRLRVGLSVALPVRTFHPGLTQHARLLEGTPLAEALACRAICPDLVHQWLIGDQSSAVSGGNMRCERSEEGILGASLASVLRQRVGTAHRGRAVSNP